MSANSTPSRSAAAHPVAEHTGIYRDLWKEYQSVLQQMRSKKPTKVFRINYDEILAHLSAIAQDMEDMEYLEQLGCVFMSMGDIYGKIDRIADQKTSYVKAGRVYARVLIQRRDLRFTTESDIGTLMEDAFLRAVKLCLRTDGPDSEPDPFNAGRNLMELGNHYAAVKAHDHAHVYLMRGARLLINDNVIDEAVCIRSILDNALYLDDLNEALSDVFTLWQAMCRNVPKRGITDETVMIDATDAIVRKVLRSVELDIVLVSLCRWLKHDELGKSVLTDYATPQRSTCPRTSVLTNSEYVEVARLVDVVMKRDSKATKRVLDIELADVIGDFGRKVGKMIVTEIDDTSAIRADLVKIRNEESNPRERIKRYFEYHALNYRDLPSKLTE